MGSVSKQAETWENQSTLLHITANGTPTSFNVAQFSLSDLRMVDAKTMSNRSLQTHLKTNKFVPSKRKLIAV